MDTPKGPGSENLIVACTTMLSYRRFSTCREFATRIPRLDLITSVSLDKIIAIADILSAVDRRLPNNLPDHYSILQLRRDDAARDRDLLTRQFKKLALLLDPTAANKFPFSDEALTCVRESWHVLSDPKSRDLYHTQIGYRPPSATFWTACPYCWNLFEYEGKYEDCPLLCQSCGKAFHGVPVTAPVKDDDQKKEYYWCQASVPLRYIDKEDSNYMYMGVKATHFDETNFVYISDDDGDDVVGGSEGFGKNVGKEVWGDVRNQGFQFQGNAPNSQVELEGTSGKRKMRMKTVARRGADNMARNRHRGFRADNDLDLDEGEGDLEFTEGDGDVFIGVRFNE
ncbi:putative DnaJ domain-containing protein [Lupinus albus]|uniref:Putative DnaJ domain-containing protein n=1 Tax=Lupinus albus TaxID=3870 RepID=A0A6A4Q0M1_LUPAL|nr:putative DnaJ domain-containing protein [Lupinus albus]